MSGEFSGRNPGTGKPANSVFKKYETPGGKAYWVDPSDPGWGYIEDPWLHKDAVKYPLTHIDYVFRDTLPTGATTRRTRTRQALREMTATALEGRIPVVYGTQRIGGTVVARQMIGSAVYESHVLAEGTCDGLLGVLLSPQKVLQTASGGSPVGLACEWNFYGGSSIGTGNGALADLYYRYATQDAGTERFPFLATWHGKIATNSLMPQYPNPKFVLKGRRVYDPRKDSTAGGAGLHRRNDVTTWEYSENPALCTADWCANDIFGVGAGMEGLWWDTVAEAAVYCDVLVASLPRHTLNIALMRGADKGAILDALRAHFRCSIFQREGKLVFAIDKIATAALTLTPATCQPLEGEMVGPLEVPTVVKVAYPNPSKDYNTDYEVARVAGVETGDVEERIAEVALDGCDNASEAARQAWYYVNEYQNRIRASLLAVHATALKLEVLDRVDAYSDSLGLGTVGTPQQFRILRVGKRANGTIALQVKAYNAAIFSDITRPVETKAEDNSPTISTVPDAPTSLVFTQLDATRVRIAWTAISWPHPITYRVTVQKNAEPVYVLAEGVLAGPVLLEFADYTATYTVAVYAISTPSGATSAALTAPFTFVIPIPPPPADVVAQVDTIANADIYWPVTNGKTFEQWGAARWSGVDMVSFTAANINNGNLTTLAAQFRPSGDEPPVSYLVLDLGVGVTREFRGGILYSAGNISGWQVEYSDDGAAWTGITITGGYSHPWTILLGDQTHTRLLRSWASVGAHRYWRISSGAYQGLGNTLNEFEFYTEDATPYAYADRYRVYDNAGRVVYETKTHPTVFAPIYVAGMVNRTWDEHFLGGEVAIVNVAGVEGRRSGFYATEAMGYKTAIVAMESTQTLANKTISAASNTLILDAADLGDGANLAKLDAANVFTALQQVKIARAAATTTLLKLGGGNGTYATGDEFTLDFRWYFDSFIAARISAYTDVATNLAGLKIYTSGGGAGGLNATPSVTLDPAGNVGIGGTPAARLHIRSLNTGTDATLQFTAEGWREWSIRARTGDGYLVIRDIGAGADRLTIDTGGGTRIHSGSIYLGSWPSDQGNDGARLVKNLSDYTLKLIINNHPSVNASTFGIYLNPTQIAFYIATNGEATLTSTGHASLTLDTTTADKYAQLLFREAGVLKWNVYNDYATDELQFGTTAGPKFKFSATGAMTAVGSGAATLLTLNNATAGKAGLRLQNNGTQTAIFSLSGLWRGDATTDLAIATESGSAIKFYTNGTGTERLVISAAGDTTIGGSLTAAGGAFFTASSAAMTLVGGAATPTYIKMDVSAIGGALWRIGHSGAVSGTPSFDVYNESSSILGLSVSAAGYVNINSTPQAVLFPLDVRDGARFFSNNGSARPGLEIGWLSGTDSIRVLAYDRVGAAFKSLHLQGLNIAVGNATQQNESYGGGEGVIFVNNRVAAPSSNPTGGGILYVEAGALKYRGSSGTVTTIANA